MAFDWVMEQIESEYSFEPFPGTLNVELTGKNREKFEEIKNREHFPTLQSPKGNECTAEMIPVSIEGRIRGAVLDVDPEYTVHGENIVEVVAPVKVMDELDLDFGDEISLYMKTS